MRSSKLRRSVGRWSKVGAALLAVALVGTACTASPATASPTTASPTGEGSGGQGEAVELRLVMHTWVGWEPVLTELIGSYEAKHPNITVKHELLEYNDLLTALTPRFASKNPPDITIADAQFPWFQQELMLDLLPFAKTDGTDFGQLVDTLSLFRMRGDARQFGLPFSMTGGLLYFNKTLFKQAGVPEPSPGWTMDDFRSAAIALTKDRAGRAPTDSGFDGGNIAVYGADFPGSGFWEPFIQNFGGRFFNEDFTAAKLDDPNTFTALKFMHQLACVDHAILGPATPQRPSGGDPFLSQNAAMALHGEWLMPVYRDIKDFDWDVAAPPAGPSDTVKVFAASNSLGITKDSQHPQEAWEFLKYLLFDKDNQIKIGTTNGPALKEAIVSEELVKLRQGERGPSEANIRWAYGAMQDNASAETVFAEQVNRDKWAPLFADFEVKLLTLCNENPDTLISEYQLSISQAIKGGG